MAGRHLYIIQSRSTGAVKVGRSDDPERRIHQLQTGSPHELRLILTMPDGGRREPHVHKHMLGHETRHVNGGEWFHESGLGDVPADVWTHAMPWYLEDPDWWRRR